MKRIMLVLLACLMLGVTLTGCRPSPKLTEFENELSQWSISFSNTD